MAQLVADFRARADAYKAEIAAAAKAMDDLPKAQQRVAQRMQAIAAKATDDQVKLRELAVIKEIQALQKLASKTPELYHQAEQAKKQILERAAQERIAIEERATATMSGAVNKFRPALAGIVQVTNSVGTAAGAAASQFTGMATGIVASIGTGSLPVVALAALGGAVAAIAGHFRDVAEAEAAANKRMAEDLAARRKQVMDLATELERADRLQRFLMSGGSEAAFGQIEKFEGALGSQGALAGRMQQVSSRLSGLIAQRAAVELPGAARSATPKSAIEAMDQEIAELRGQYVALAREFGLAAQNVARLRADVEDQGPLLGTWTPFGPPQIRTGKSPAQRQQDLVDANAAAEVENMRRINRAINARVRNAPDRIERTLMDFGAGPGGLDEQIAFQERDRQSAAASEVERSKLLGRLRAQAEKKAHEKFLAEEAKSQTYIRAGLAAGGQFALGFGQALAKGDGTAPSIFKIFTSVLGTLLSVVNPAAGAAFGTITGLLPFRAGGAPGLPQGRGGLGAGVNFDARLAHFDHPEEWKLSRQAVAGLGGVDAAARLNRDAAAGRLGLGGHGNVTLVLPTLLPSDAAAAVRQAVRPGLETIMSNWQSGALRHDLQRYSDRARAS